MDTAYVQHLSRLSRLLIAGIGVAFAWLLLSFALGASSPAHADDNEGGLLGAVGSLVNQTTAVVADTATAATGLVTETAAGAVDALAPVVQQVTDAAPAVAPVIDVVEQTGTAVADLTAGGVVTPVIDPVLDLVGAVPIVGTAVSALGVDTAVSSGGAAVDTVIHQATTGVGGTVSGVVEAPGTGGTLPALPPVGAPHETFAATPALGTAPAAAGAVETAARAAYAAGTVAWLPLASGPLEAAAIGASVTGEEPIAAVLMLLRSLVQADSVLIGPGGAGPGAWVLVALGFVVAYRAWMRRAGPENDAAPPAPVLATDVSPD